MGLHVTIFLLSVAYVGAKPSTSKSVPTDIDLVSSLVKTIYSSEEHEYVLVLIHDYPILPSPLVSMMMDIHKQGGSALSVQWTESTPPPKNDPGPGKFEYWFSWLERPTSRIIGKFVMFLFIFHGDHFRPMLTYSASVTRLNPRADRFIYFSPDSDIGPAILHPELSFLYQMGLVYDQSSSSIQIWNNCHYCDAGNAKLVHRGIKTSSGIIPHDIHFFPDYTRNLYGSHINISFLIETTPDDIKYMIESGLPVFPYFLVYMDLGELLNFEWHFDVPPEIEGVENEIMMEDGNWTGMVGSLQNRQNHIGAAFCDGNAMSVVDLPNCFYNSAVTCARRTPRPLFSWIAIFKPYTNGMWSGVFFAALITSIVFLIILKTRYKIQYPFPANEQPPSSDVLYSFRYVFSALIEENPNLVPIPSSIRILICFWWLFCDLIICGYEAKFFGFLVSPDMEKLPNSFKEMVEWPAGWEWGAMDFVKGSLNILTTNSEIEYHQKMGHKMQDGKDMTACVLRASKEDFSCISVAEILVAVAYQMMDLEGNIPVEILPDNSLHLIGAITVVKYHKLNMVIKRYQYHYAACGVLLRYIKDFREAIAAMNLKTAREKRLLYKLSMALQISQLKGPLVMLCGFLAISALALIGELIHFRSERRRRLGSG